MTEKTCPCCSHREAVMRYYDKHVADGDVGAFIDGVMEAIARVAAVNVVTGREADERQILIDDIGRRFDNAVLARATAEAAEAHLQ